MVSFAYVMTCIASWGYLQTIKKCYDLHEGIICMYYNLRGFMQVFYAGYNLHYLLIYMNANN